MEGFKAHDVFRSLTPLVDQPGNCSLGSPSDCAVRCSQANNYRIRLKIFHISAESPQRSSLSDTAGATEGVGIV